MPAQSLVRAASAAVGAVSLALVIPAAASASTAGPASHAAPRINLHCNSWALIGWNPGNRVYGGGTMTCQRPFPKFPRTVDVTLYRNRTAVAYGRNDCFGTGDNTVCNANSPAVRNPKGYQNWCAVSKATYTEFYHKTSRICWRG